VDAVVAAATMLLALGTFWLARAARADVNAQTRPVLLVAAPPDKAHPSRIARTGGRQANHSRRTTRHTTAAPKPCYLNLVNWMQATTTSVVAGAVSPTVS
jgi:hypothetical protein